MTMLLLASYIFTHKTYVHIFIFFVMEQYTGTCSCTFFFDYLYIVYQKHEQSSKQQLIHPTQERAAQSWVKVTAHWLFTYEQAWMQHKQQKRSASWLQQLEAALANRSAGSDDFAFSTPGGRFFAVAVKLPKPTPNFPKNTFFGPSDSTIFCSFSFLDTCFSGI